MTIPIIRMKVTEIKIKEKTANIELDCVNADGEKCYTGYAVVSMDALGLDVTTVKWGDVFQVKFEKEPLDGPNKTNT